jgi:hypothetical protein
VWVEFHKVKMLGAWITEPAGHQAFVVFEAPSLEDFQKFNMEPEVLATNAYRTFETHIVMSMEEEAKLRQAKKPTAKQNPQTPPLFLCPAGHGMPNSNVLKK